MRIETSISAPSIPELAALARRMEDAGYDGITTPETGHDPFLPLMTIAEHTKSLRLGTSVAMAFPRSPLVMAQIAWDLQRYSGGRLNLGIATQVKGHNERRYSTPWTSAPGPRLREYIECLRAIFNTFQNNAPANYKGKHYQFTLMSPTFNPGPNPDGGRLPIYIAAVNTYNARLAGEICDGIRLHSFNTTRYTKEVLLPAIATGAMKGGRRLSDIDVVAVATIVTGKDEAEVERNKWPAKKQIAFYGSTRTYHPVLRLHGWDEVGMRLHRLSIEGKWDEMANEITDEILEEFAVVATYDNLIPKVKERYQGVVNTLAIRSLEDEERRNWMVRELKKA